MRSGARQHDPEETRIVPSGVLRALAQGSAEGGPNAPLVVVEERVAAVSPFDRRAEPDEVQQLDRVMFEKLAAKDRSGALLAAEAILKLEPGHTAALRAERNCRVVLEALYREAIGPEVPLARASAERLADSTGHCGTAFVFALRAGSGDLASLLEMSAMPRFETLRVLYDLLSEGLVEAVESVSRSTERPLVVDDVRPSGLTDGIGGWQGDAPLPDDRSADDEPTTRAR